MPNKGESAQLQPGQDGNTDTTGQNSNKEKKSELAIWLEKCDVDVENIKKFNEAGYVSKKDINGDIIQKIICSDGKDKCTHKGHPGLIAKLTRLINEESKWENEKKNISLDMPKLPADTIINLSKPEPFKDYPDFKLSELMPQVQAGEDPILPTTIPDNDWILIARNSKMLYGRRLDTDKLDHAHKSVFHWRVPESMDFLQNKSDEAMVKSDLTYSQRDANKVCGGLDKGALSIAAGYGSFSGGVAMEVSNERKSSTAKSSSELYIVGIWDFPRAKIFLSDCTRISESFTKEVEDALKLPYFKSKMELQKIFRDYGHVYSEEIELGGRLYFIHQTSKSDKKSDDQQKWDVKAAASAKFSSYAKAEASAEHHTAYSNSEDIQEIAERISFNSIGGNTLLTNNPAKWVESLKDHKLWTVINLNNAQLTLNLLKPEIREKVKSILRGTSSRGVICGYECENDRSLNILYPDIEGHIYELNKLKSFACSTIKDLTEAAKSDNINILASSAPFGYNFNEAKYVIFRSTDDHIYEIKFGKVNKGKYTCVDTIQKAENVENPLSATEASAAKGLPAPKEASAAKGNPCGFGLGDTRYVVYRGIDNFIHLLSCSDSDNKWKHINFGKKTAGDPCCYTQKGIIAVVYRDPDGHICELKKHPGAKWDAADLSNIASKSSDHKFKPNDRAVSDPCCFVLSDGDLRQIVYIAKDGHIHGYSFNIDGKIWNHLDLFVEANIPNIEPHLAAGKPSGYAIEDNKSKHVIYRDRKGRIHELSWLEDENWSWRNLSAMTNAPDTADNPSGFVWNAGGSQHVAYYGDDGNIYELSSPDGENWHHKNLSEEIYRFSP